MSTFSLRIPANAAIAGAMKRQLATSLPAIKSSHLTEAIARGLRFNSHASLLANTSFGHNTLTTVSGVVFAEFLRERDYDVDERVFYMAAARVAIRCVMENEPRLTHWGYGNGRPKRKPDGKRENATEHHARFLVAREQLLSDGSAEEFLRSLVFVQLISPIKSINRRIGSYALKHRAEKLPCTFPGGTILGPHYVANGSLIVAAVHAGFKYKAYIDELGYEDINVAFNMSQTSLDDVLYRFLEESLKDDRKHRAVRRLSNAATAGVVTARLA